MAKPLHKKSKIQLPKEEEEGLSKGALRNVQIRQWVKMGVLALLFLYVSYFFGDVCGDLGSVYGLLLSGPQDIAPMGWPVLASFFGVLLLAGLVATLVKPLKLALILALLSGGALFLSSWNIVFALVYAGFMFVYFGGVKSDIAERITFGVRSITDCQGLLIFMLLFVMVGSFHLGMSSHIDENGVEIPQTYVLQLKEQIEAQIQTQVPAEMRDQVMLSLDAEFEKSVDSFSKNVLSPYQDAVPWFISVSLFVTLVTLSILFRSVAFLLFLIVFPLLKLLRFTTTKTEMIQKEEVVLS